MADDVAFVSASISAISTISTPAISRAGFSRDVIQTIGKPRVVFGQCPQRLRFLPALWTFENEHVVGLAAGPEYQRRLNQISRPDCANVFTVFDVEVRLQPGFKRGTPSKPRIEIVSDGMEGVVSGRCLYGAPNIASRWTDFLFFEPDPRQGLVMVGPGRVGHFSPHGGRCLMTTRALKSRSQAHLSILRLLARSRSSSQG